MLILICRMDCRPQQLAPSGITFWGTLFGCYYQMIYLRSPKNFDLQHYAIVHVAGSATNINKDDSTFEIHAAHYKPIPGKGKSVLIKGLLTGAERNADHTVKHFSIDLQKVTFIGQAPFVLTLTPALLRVLSSWFFGSGTKSDEPASKNRKTADDRALEESGEQVHGYTASLVEMIQHGARQVDDGVSRMRMGNTTDKFKKVSTNRSKMEQQEKKDVILPQRN
ncbi:hypothetical protein B0H14DRAFT_2622287 [Mycena olivaceomarginata]|nr:hypothetical protein B0H14DRAFT_2622287 [Mycena olivaceomarginata]